jgi:hypothetical protein
MEAEWFSHLSGALNCSEDKYDITMTFHFEEDAIFDLKNRSSLINVPMTYASVNFEAFHEQLRNQTNVKKSYRKDILASIFLGNCRIHLRNAYVEHLMLLIPIHSYGFCMPNMKPENVGCPKKRANGDLQAHTDWYYRDKLCVIRQYKFYLAFENSMEESYVTEKFFHGMLVGCLICLNVLMVYMFVYFD